MVAFLKKFVRRFFVVVAFNPELSPAVVYPWFFKTLFIKSSNKGLRLKLSYF